MKRTTQLLTVGGLLLLGCDDAAAPRMSLPTNSTTTETKPSEISATTPRTQPAKVRYQGRTPEEWGDALHGEDLNKVREAAMALKVLRGDGQPLLVKGLESPLPETRRLCLESLTVGDLRAHGDQGRKLLIKLAGDRMDLRIRERATRYLIEWDRSLPTP
jgi:hypothetical protein